MQNNVKTLTGYYEVVNDTCHLCNKPHEKVIAVVEGKDYLRICEACLKNMLLLIVKK